ncbi:hypothetical protein [Streptomyces flavofungini]|uniref:hypothetical protein n=1 Tax=Streptomyces flavofungini TaxID=68200 RepID=UPI0025AEE0BD|nr:hypothetical protein [Streptomyces flavofungini]WJV45586.1 hypothetical protein QUY26_08585 [Streptomyces flavofungini]
MWRLDGEKYTSETTAYNDAYEPTSSTVTIPAKAGALAGTYTWTFGYNRYAGQQEWIMNPAVGNLPSERQTTIYGEGNLPQKTGDVGWRACPQLSAYTPCHDNKRGHLAGRACELECNQRELGRQQ